METTNSKYETLVDVPHEPTLQCLFKEEEKYYAYKPGFVKDKSKEYLVDKVGEFHYTDDDFRYACKTCQEAGLDLDTFEIDTKMFRRARPDLEFDAFKLIRRGGFDAYEHFEFDLYKIIKVTVNESEYYAMHI
jgi:hypothetical protein